MTLYHAPRRILRGTSACRRANNNAIAAPGQGRRGRREWARDQYSDQRKRAISGIVPADVKKTIAFGTPHAGRLVFEAGPLAAIGTDAIPRAPGEGEPRGARRSR